MIPRIIIEKHLKEFLEEDLAIGDVTSAFVPSREVRANIEVKESGTVAGIEVAEILFEIMDIGLIDSVPDGSPVEKNQVIMSVEGNSRNILMVERTALNILGRMSGIATVAKEMVGRARRANPSIRIAATRKTTPGFRLFEKMAAVIAGADSHRFFTGDAVLIKNNHLSLIGGVKKALQMAKSSSFIRKIEVEVRNMNEAIEAAEEGVDVIMFDNMSPDTIRAAMKRIKELGLGDSVLFEASGGIKPENVEEYARTGVDVISSGYITHSARVLDMSMYFTE